MTDARSYRTRKNLQDALIISLNEEGFDSLTVQSIVKKAGISRSTFYRHFQDKESLLFDLEQDQIKGLIKAFRAPYIYARHYNVANISSSSIAIFQYILEHKDFFNLIVRSRFLSKFQQKMIDEMTTLLKEDLKYLMPSTKEKTNLSQFIIFRAYGIFGIVIEWIKRGFQESPEYMSQQLLRVISFTPAAVYKRDS
ncbi:TetR/AcrR family transcriptional regulator [Halalkalibacillus halophilus]|uniref:TetR/AcrR family transcriptional regulator n=1 Tax=Halalkalibacillus halophilus TaxID=392827 RepID=UPI000414EBA9|nr:TetR/AcrR family transcriptional regulator [Halalkalibacillus halophilus]